MPVPIVPNYGRIVVLKRTGQDSASFDLTDDNYLFGRGTHCDIRIQLSTIAEEHCRIYRDAAGRAVVENMSIQGTIVNGLTLAKEQSHVLNNGDIMTVVERSFRFECDFPIKTTEHESDMIHFTPNKAGHSEDVQKTPSKRTASMTPKKVSLVGRATGDSFTKTPVKTPVKSARNTPINLNSTPSKSVGEDKLVMTSGIIGSPMRTMKLMGSPMRVATSVNSEKVTELINEFAPESTNKTPRRSENQQQALFEVTPVKQIEQAPQSMSREGSTVSKFNISELRQTPPKSPSNHPDDPAGNPSSTLVDSHLTGLATPPPPPRNSLGSPNINLLFPPTPALAAASKLAESIAVAGSSTADTPSTRGTPITSSQGTPTFKGTPKQLAADSNDTIVQELSAPQKTTQISNTMSPHQMATGSSKPGTPKVNSPCKIVGSPRSVVVLETAGSSRSPKAMPGSPTLVPGTPIVQKTPSTKETPASPKKVLASTASSVKGTPMIIKETPPAPGSPMAIAESMSFAANHDSTPIRSFHPHPPGRSPRFSVASEGSPVILDKEITGSPKLTKVDFYCEPNAIDEYGSGNITTQVYADDDAGMVDKDPTGVLDAAIKVVKSDDENEGTLLVEANLPGTVKADEEQQPTEPIKLADQMQIDANGPAKPEQEKETDKVSLTCGEGQVAGNTVEAAPTADSMKTIQTTTTSEDLLKVKGLSIMDAIASEEEVSAVFEEIENTLNEVTKTEGEKETATLIPEDVGILAPLTQETANSQTVTFVVSSLPSTPRRSTRLVTVTKAPANADKRTPATAGRKTPAPSKEKTPKTTTRKSSSARKTPAATKSTSSQEENGRESQESVAPATRSRTPRTTVAAARTKAAMIKTPATEPRVRATSNSRNSTRKMPVTSTKVTTTGGGRGSSSSQREQNHEAGEEIDTTSPSLHSRAARTRQKRSKGEKGDEDDNENTPASTNIATVTVVIKKTPVTKRALEQIDDASEAEADSLGRRRSMRARTPAKMH